MFTMFSERKNRSRMRKLTIAVICGVLVLLAGCGPAPTKQSDVRRSLKVMFWDEGYFFQQYGDLFSMRYGDVDIEVVSTNSMYRGGAVIEDQYQATLDFIEEQKPDVVMVDSSSYEKMVSDGKLMELDSFITRDKYDTESIYPALIEMLKEKGAGKLYGLSPTFQGQALFYNVDLFNKYGIDPPQNNITWQEIFDLARRFPTDGDADSRVYGYGAQYGMNFSSLASMISSTEGLSQVNPDTMKVTMNTDAWKRAYKLAFDALESGSVYNPEDGGFSGGSMEDYYKSQLFLMGRMAMTLGDPYTLQNMKESKTYIKDYNSFEIGIVAGPVDPADPETSRNIYFSDIFAIRADSPNADAAWDFIKFINGEEYAKVKSRTLNNGLLSRMGYSKEYDGYSLDAFYALKPKLDQSASYERMSKIPSDFYMQFYTVQEEQLKLVQEKKKSVEEALQAMEQEGQVILDKAIKDQEANKGKEDTGSNGAESSSTSGGGISIEVGSVDSTDKE